jgi:hypothetical protein
LGREEYRMEGVNTNTVTESKCRIGREEYRMEGVNTW